MKNSSCWNTSGGDACNGLGLIHKDAGCRDANWNRFRAPVPPVPVSFETFLRDGVLIRFELESKRSKSKQMLNNS